MVCRDGTAIKRMCKWVVCPPPVYRACEQGYIYTYSVLTYQQLLLASFLPPLADQPPRRAEEGEEEEGKGTREGNKGKTNMYVHENRLVLDLW